MTDGAHLNIGAESAMKTILGSKDEEEPLSAEAFEKKIREATILDGDDFDYDAASAFTARLVLEAYERYPMLRDHSDNTEYLTGKDGKIDWNNPIPTNRTLYEIIKRIYPEHLSVFRDLTGFMWGWAVNAARNILDLGPLPNPALMTLTASHGND